VVNSAAYLAFVIGSEGISLTILTAHSEYGQGLSLSDLFVRS
jgi:hypothetical protein